MKAELERYNELKRRVQESTFKKNLLRNIQVSACLRGNHRPLPPHRRSRHASGARKSRCILGVGAGVFAVRDRDEERTPQGTKWEVARHGATGKAALRHATPRRCRMSDVVVRTMS